MNVKRLRAYARLKLKRDALKEEEADISRRMAILVEGILFDMVEDQMDSLPVVVAGLDGGERFTIYASQEVYATPAEGCGTAEVTAALRRVAPDLISYHAQTLSAYVRERLGDQGKPLPPSLAKVVSVKTRSRIGMRRSPKKSTPSSRAAVALAKK